MFPFPNKSQQMAHKPRLPLPIGNMILFSGGGYLGRLALIDD